MGPETNHRHGCSTRTEFFIYKNGKMKYNSWVPADMQMEAMHCNIGENRIILCRRVYHKYYYEAKTN